MPAPAPDRGWWPVSGWRPGLGDFFKLDETAVRTEYLKAKGARLVLDHQATWIQWRSTKTEQWFWIRGDHAVYTVVLRPLTDPWTAACSRRGQHEATPDGQACAHGLAAAVAWVRMSPSLQSAAEEVWIDAE